MKRKETLFLLVISWLALLSPAVQAETPEPFSHNRIRAGFTISQASTWDDGHDSEELGFGLGGEYLFNDRVGIGYGAFTAKINPWYLQHDEARMTPVTVSALFHMTPGRAVDFYLGPGVAWVHYSEGDRGRELDDDLSPMFQIGFDALPEGSPFGFNLDLKHILHTGNYGSDFHSVTIGVGFVVRF